MCSNTLSSTQGTAGQALTHLGWCNGHPIQCPNLGADWEPTSHVTGERITARSGADVEVPGPQQWGQGKLLALGPNGGMKSAG
jgi:hypothetical protein